MPGVDTLELRKAALALGRGGSITIVSGRSRNRGDSRYGCSAHAQRGDSVCKNGLLVRRINLERQLLAGLQERVLHPDVVDYTLKRFEDELGKALATRRQGDADLGRLAGELERGIANQLRALSDGYSPAITAEIARLEQHLCVVRERLKATDPAATKLRIRDTRRFVESRLSDLSEVWKALGPGPELRTSAPVRIAREEIAKHVGRITLKPALRTYVASGIWDWLGVLGSAATMVVPGARFAPRVPRNLASHWPHDYVAAEKWSPSS